MGVYDVCFLSLSPASVFSIVLVHICFTMEPTYLLSVSHRAGIFVLAYSCSITEPTRFCWLHEVLPEAGRGMILVATSGSCSLFIWLYIHHARPWWFRDDFSFYRVYMYSICIFFYTYICLTFDQ